MSSRALRRLQREQEQQQQQQQQLKKLHEDEPQGDESQDDAASDEGGAPLTKIVNAFDMLNGNDEGGNEDDDSVHSLEPKVSPNGKATVQTIDYPTPSAKVKSKTKPRKKKKNKKPHAKREDEEHATSIAHNTSGLDEIDLALQSLSTNPQESANNHFTDPPKAELAELCRLLAVESKHLNALNEMKRLFGNVVLEPDNEDAGTPGPGRRRGRGPQNLDLGGALAGRNSPASRGQGLAGLALRRNVFMPGKEEWPKATSGGLGMDTDGMDWDGTTQYRFVHNTAYQDVQNQFESCVESMDPQRMIQLLQFNPYHISTLLQVSEIAKHQGDHSVAGDLLERALFSFGRSVHSSFISALSEGKARLDFRRPENREFWLASWQYIINLGQRGTWRTAYEWAKLLLILDPEEDPYCLHLILDQLALRGGQAEHFVALVSDSNFAQIGDRERMPNILISYALATYKLKRPEESRSSLARAISTWPWIFAHLFHELNIEHIPRSIWGKEPRSDREKFESKIYVTRAKDLWNTPEAISFLVEVAESVELYPNNPVEDDPITLNEARHILLSDTPSLISLLPRRFTTMQTTSSDPLPPPANISSYSTASTVPHPTGPMPPWLFRDSSPVQPALNEESQQELHGLQAFFSRIIPWIGLGAPPTTTPENQTAADLERAVSESGIPAEIIVERGARLLELQQRSRADEEQRLHMIEVAQQLIEGSLGDLESLGPVSALDDDNDNDNDDDDEFDIPPTDNPSPPQRNPSPIPDSLPATSDPDPDPEPEPYSDDRNQRWLAGQGLFRLRDFVAHHGTDESAWSNESIADDGTGSGEIVDDGVVVEYARRVGLLRSEATRRFIVEYMLPQGTSREVRALVVRYCER